MNNDWQNSLGETLNIDNYKSDKLQWQPGFPTNQKCTGFYGSNLLGTQDCVTPHGIVCETDFLWFQIDLS